jgi:formate dehydrogenase subunit gamma
VSVIAATLVWPVKRMALMSLLARFRFASLILAISLLAMPAVAQQRNPDGSPNPAASSVKEQSLLKQSPRVEGWVAIPDQKTGVLIQPAGRTWRYFHEVTLRWLGGIVILGTLVALALAYLILGPIRLQGGRSGQKVPRFNAFERFVHWLTAASFIILALTGLNITFGRALLLPVMGPDAFTAFSEAAKYAHDFTSFPFMLGVGLMIVHWLKDNIPRRIDIEWFKQGGGFIPSKHPPAGRFNAGEKVVFWLVLGGGVAVTVSGLLLLFPFYATNIAGQQIAQVVHGIIAMLFVALILGHIYIGTLGTEAAFEAMGTGEVDLNWAKEHHALWLDEQIAKDRVPGVPPRAPAHPAE